MTITAREMFCLDCVFRGTVKCNNCRDNSLYRFKPQLDIEDTSSTDSPDDNIDTSWCTNCIYCDSVVCHKCVCADHYCSIFSEQEQDDGYGDDDDYPDMDY